MYRKHMIVVFQKTRAGLLSTIEATVVDSGELSSAAYNGSCILCDESLFRVSDTPESLKSSRSRDFHKFGVGVETHIRSVLPHDECLIRSLRLPIV